jgi:hypothetical protein
MSCLPLQMVYNKLLLSFNNSPKMNPKPNFGRFPYSINLPGTWDGHQFANEDDFVHHLDDLEIQEVKDALIKFKGMI